MVNFYPLLDQSKLYKQRTANYLQIGCGRKKKVLNVRRRGGHFAKSLGPTAPSPGTSRGLVGQIIEDFTTDSTEVPSTRSPMRNQFLSDPRSIKTLKAEDGKLFTDSLWGTEKCLKR